MFKLVGLRHNSHHSAAIGTLVSGLLDPPLRDSVTPLCGIVTFTPRDEIGPISSSAPIIDLSKEVASEVIAMHSRTCMRKTLSEIEAQIQVETGL